MSASADLACVDPGRITEIWPAIRNLIKPALERSDLGRFDDLEIDVLKGDALVWVAYSGLHIEAAAVTQIILTERSKVCMVQACGGSNRARWLRFLEPIENYAKQQGCHCVRIMGRKGWARVLKKYSETRVILERQL